MLITCLYFIGVQINHNCSSLGMLPVCGLLRIYISTSLPFLPERHDNNTVVKIQIKMICCQTAYYGAQTHVCGNCETIQDPLNSIRRPSYVNHTFEASIILFCSTQGMFVLCIVRIVRARARACGLMPLAVSIFSFHNVR